MPHTPPSQNNPPAAAGLTLKPARAILMVAAIVAALALLAPYPSTMTASAADLDGKTIFLREKCNVCHSIPSQGIEAKIKSEKMLGPELPTAEKREDTEILLDYLRQKAELDGEKTCLECHDQVHGVPDTGEMEMWEGAPEIAEAVDVELDTGEVGE